MNVHWSGFHKDLENSNLKTGENYSLVANGVAYTLVPENIKTSMKGHGGHAFLFKLEDGTALYSTNVWCAGEIPKEYRDILQDTAEIVPHVSWTEYGLSAFGRRLDTELTTIVEAIK